MALNAGDRVLDGLFIVNESRPGRCEIIHESGAPQFSGPSEAKALAAGASWVRDQAARKQSKLEPAAAEPEPNPDLIEA